MANKAFTAWDFIQYKLQQQRTGQLPTKRRFGEIMHDDSMTEDEKHEIAERVLMAGGYDVLEDDNQ